MFPKQKISFTALFFFAFFMMAASFAGNDGQRRWRQDKDPAPEVAEELVTTLDVGGFPLEMLFTKGSEHNHPLMAIWVEDMDSNYIQTLYVAESIGKGVFKHGDPSSGRWMPGPLRRPAALPYWGHQRRIKAGDGYYIPTMEDPVPDAITGPTPKGNFILKSQTPGKDLRQLRLLFEINQSWNWNEYWTNDKFPGDEHYMTSSQPALVYEAIIDLDEDQKEYVLQPIGHSHWSGQNGNLYEDLGTITTALEITGSVKVRIPGQ